MLESESSYLRANLRVSETCLENLLKQIADSLPWVLDSEVLYWGQEFPFLRIPR